MQIAEGILHKAQAVRVYEQSPSMDLEGVASRIAKIT
jgi:hypothetical protein